MASNRLAAGCLVLFGLPFAAAGLFSIWMSSQAKTPKEALVTVLAGSAFTLVGVGLMIAASVGSRKASEIDRLKSLYPGQPWMWRTDWASGVSRSRDASAAVGMWAIAILWNLVCAPGVILVLPDMARKGDARALFLLPFVGVGIWLLTDALRKTIRRVEFGVGVLDLRSPPFKLGGSLAGAIHARFHHMPEKSVNLRCTCIQRTVSGSGNSRSVNEQILWREEASVPPSALAQTPEGVTIPISFRIPPDQQETYAEDPSNQILWIVQATADVPGVDYDDSFEVPVFGKVAQPAAAESAGGAAATTAFAPSAPEPERHTILVQPTADGVQFYFPADRNPGAATGLTIFFAIFAAAFVFLVKMGAPIIFPIVFGFFDALMLLIALYTWFGTSKVTIGSGQLTAHSGILGLGPTRVVALDQIQSIDYAIGMQTGGAQGTPYYDIRLTPASGNQVTLGSGVKDKKELEWLLAQMRAAAGVKPAPSQDAVPADLITPSYKPLLSPMPAGAVKGKPPLLLRMAGLIISLAIFGSFAWRAGFISDLTDHLKLKVRQSSAPALERPTLTDADLQRILRMSPQHQAERLMEAAIQHDPAAREAILANAARWRGRLSNTPTWQKLEYRATYSKDLRVRAAVLEADLAMWKLEKTPQAVRRLVAQGEADHSTRPQNAYRLGVLANRGVEPELVHRTLLEYTHDSDPATRQWAVEGMRFLGTDQALDDLFDIFQHDDSMTVRDRAGCNVSECGIFTRVQRMHMVPKLLALSADPTLNPTMRHWVFLALSEITDESLPEDAAAWGNWYAQHGAAKLAQFQRQPSWQVRGNE